MYYRFRSKMFERSQPRVRYSGSTNDLLEPDLSSASIGWNDDLKQSLFDMTTVTNTKAQCAADVRQEHAHVIQTPIIVFDSEGKVVVDYEYMLSYDQQQDGPEEDDFSLVDEKESFVRDTRSD